MFYILNFFSGNFLFYFSFISVTEYNTVCVILLAKCLEKCIYTTLKHDD